MAVTTEITRIQQAKADICTAIQFRGGSDVSSSLLSDNTFKNAINNLEGTLHYNPRTGNYISYNGDFYAKLCEYPLWFWSKYSFSLKLKDSSSLTAKTFLYTTTTTADAYEQPDLTGKTWSTMTLGTAISVPANTFICIKSESTVPVSSTGSYRAFTISNNNYHEVWCGGNIQSLMNFSTTLPSGATFQYLFYDSQYNSTSLKSAPLLPYKDLSNTTNIYQYMFRDCKSLEYPPILPATVLCKSCYYAMFLNCFSLKWFPDLPAPEFKSGCYAQMFSAVKRPCRLKCMTYKNYSTNATQNWLQYTTPYFGFLITPHPEIFTTNSPSGIPENWQAKTTEYNMSQYRNNN